MPQLDFDGANSKISADKIQGQSGTTVTIPTGHNLVGNGSGLTSLPAGNLTGTIAGINLKDYGEVTNALGSAGGARTIDLTLGNSVTATASTSTNTWTFSNPTASDELCGFTLMLTNGGSQTMIWPASVDWAGGTAPTLTSSGVDCLVFWTVDGGTIWNGGLVGADLS